MNQNGMSTPTRILAGALAGIVAGAAASFAMDRFQAAVTALSTSDDGEDGGEPSTEKAADGVARKLTGAEVPDAEKPLAGQAVHYALGMTLGVAYGIAAEFRPAVTVGYGTGFGVATATLLDEGLVPALGLGEAPWKASASSNAYSYVSHLVFGAALEMVRSQVAGSWRTGT